MTCTYCGTTLPPGALFCGECGRRVAPAAAADPVTSPPRASPPRTSPKAESTPDAAAEPGERQPALQPPVIPPPPAPELEGPPPATPVGAVVPPTIDIEGLSPASRGGSPAPGPTVADAAAPGHPSPLETPVARREPVCEQCGTPMAPGDIFCGECGFVSRAVTDAFSGSIPTAEVRSRASRSEARRVEVDPLAAPSSPSAAVSPAPVSPAPTTPAPVSPAPVSAAPPEHPAPVAPPPAAPAPPAAATAFPLPPPGADDDEDVEETRIVPRRGGERFVLQFSTGESVSVYGTGLIGRNPRSEPGEFFDQLVRVLDGGRSVSKTHLEFGQEAGSFWIKDRHSGNGTILREPDAPPRRCEPEKRYRVVGGSRVELGEQFFVVS